MSVESASFVSELDPVQPPGSDLRKEGDNHLRLLKTVLKATFPNASRAIYDQRGVTQAANVTLTKSVNKKFYDVNAGSGNITITLPSGMLTTDDGWSIVLCKSDATQNKVIIVPDTGTIQGQTNITLRGQYEIVRVFWTGTAWRCDQRSFNPWVKARAITADETLTTADYGNLLLVGPVATNITITLPTVVNFGNSVIGVKNTGTAGKLVVIDGSGTQTIDGALTLSLDEGDIAWLVAYASGWQVYNFSPGGGFGPSTVNTWTATQIFDNASLVEYEQTLVNTAGSVAWNHNLGNHAKITLSAVAAFAKPTNMRVGQSGLLRITMSAAVAVTFHSTFFFLTGDPVLANGTVSVFEYFVSAANNIYIWQVAGSGGYVDYDQGALINGTTYTEAHGLGALPARVEVLLKCTSTSQGFAANDYVQLSLGGFATSGVDAGVSASFNTTNVKVQVGNNGIPVVTSSGAIAIVTAANFDVIIRVYA